MVVPHEDTKVFGSVALGANQGVLFMVLGSAPWTEQQFLSAVDHLVSLKKRNLVRGGCIVLGGARLPTAPERHYMMEQIAPFKQDKMHCAVLSDNTLFRATINGLGTLLRVAQFHTTLRSFATSQLLMCGNWVGEALPLDPIAVASAFVPVANSVGYSLSVTPDLSRVA